MSKAKHTPGPWKWQAHYSSDPSSFWHKPGLFWELQGEAARPVIKLHDEGSQGSDGWEENYQLRVSDPDAHLIAAAPALYGALILAQAMIEPENQPPQWTTEEALKRIRAALVQVSGDWE